MRGVPLRSNPEVYSLGNSITIKPDFLASTRQMKAPEVWAYTVRFTGTVGAITGGAKGRDAAKLFDNIRFRDADDVLNVSGAGLRVLEQLDWGAKQVDPADIASGNTNTTYSYLLRISFAPWRARRPRDFAIPVSNFLDGGEFTLQMAAAVPTGWAAPQADWKVQIFADVRDGRKPELKSRRRLKEEAVVQQEYDYQINGFLRAAILSSKLTTTGYTDLSGFTTLNSRTLAWPAAFQTALLTDEYRRESTYTAANDEFLLAATAAVPVVVPRDDQLTGRTISTKSLHLDLLQAAPTSGRLITDVIIDRDPVQSTMQMGFGSPGQLGAALKARGRVKGEDGDYSTREFNADLARRLPVTIPGIAQTATGTSS
jgi:hypothetical protein